MFQKWDLGLKKCVSDSGESVGILVFQIWDLRKCQESRVKKLI